MNKWNDALKDSVKALQDWMKQEKSVPQLTQALIAGLQAQRDGTPPPVEPEAA